MQIAFPNMKSIMIGFQLSPGDSAFEALFISSEGVQDPHQRLQLSQSFHVTCRITYFTNHSLGRFFCRVNFLPMTSINISDLTVRARWRKDLGDRRLTWHDTHFWTDGPSLHSRVLKEQKPSRRRRRREAWGSAFPISASIYGCWKQPIEKHTTRRQQPLDSDNFQISLI